MNTQNETHTHSFTTVEEAGVIRVNFLDKVIDKEKNIKRAELAAHTVYEILEAQPEKKFSVLVDMSRMGESHIPLKASKVYLQALRRQQIQKVAVVGNFKTQLKVLSFLTPFIVGEGKKVTWFPNVMEALLWLEK